ncbi:DUF1853 family protein [Aggregatimonas sangjinii]|uniref:DUF1853 family protein n=1 Tax=Aggregatimonas sangjinii TaxID=2583587 RepID=A0A5B7SS18_9FLAO|nr:DUF1853 family protein [Aggregatimonas sangjinii]QCW99832.1 DUF1853 family protein [Aggregatimonas sangjinii]
MDLAFRKKQCIGFLNTPPLWINEQFNIQQFELPEIDLTEFEPKAIPSKIRLGHQMEYVFKQLVEYHGNYEILLHNLPVHRGKQTIGEIDFILKSLSTEQLVHVELTYKFYIINPEISEPIHQLMGPNKRDMFFTKMEKIKKEQFRLLHAPEGISALSEKGVNPAEVLHRTCYKAQLFKPFKSDASHIRPLNTDCIVGYWLRFDDFNSEAFKDYRFYIPYKSEWVVAPHDKVHWTPHFETLMDINLRILKKNAPMVWMRKSDSVFEKFFVVWWK